jgi:hypothetical protein
VQAFLHNMEVERGNAISTRNQRLTALHVFFEYLGRTTRSLPASPPRTVFRFATVHSSCCSTTPVRASQRSRN